MYTSIYFVLFFIINLTWGRNAKVDQQKSFDDLKLVLHDLCVKQVGVDEANIEKYKKGDYVDDRKVKCYIKCLLWELAVVDENGYHIEAVEGILPADMKETTHRILIECPPKADAVKDLCEKSYSLFRCAFAIDPEHFNIF